VALYSQRSAIIGSTFVALRAGTRAAGKATAINKAATTVNVSGSVALTQQAASSEQSIRRAR